MVLQVLQFNKSKIQQLMLRISNVLRCENISNPQFQLDQSKCVRGSIISEKNRHK